MKSFRTKQYKWHLRGLALVLLLLLLVVVVVVVIVVLVVLVVVAVVVVVVVSLLLLSNQFQCFAEVSCNLEMILECQLHMDSYSIRVSTQLCNWKLMTNAVKSFPKVDQKSPKFISPVCCFLELFQHN